MDSSAPGGPARAGRPRIAGRSRAMLAVAAAALLGIAVILALTTWLGRAKAAPQPTARNFALTELGQPGRSVSLAALAGKPVLINFFASWCGPCQHETPLLARFYRSHHGQVLVIGIDSNDQTASALKFVRAEGVQYPVAADPFPAPVTVSYGVLALPQTFFLNAQHKIVRHIVGQVTLAELTSWASTLAGSRPG
jgi:cytochrome c biogenesis protein CcmG, thiol:disulfide interchange protein DsbE